MKIFDISQELFTSDVYPGDKAPSFRRSFDINNGDMCTVTELEMNAHNGTHVDAPAHFIKNGDTIEKLPLDKLIGKCRVKTFDGEITEEDIIALGGNVGKLLCRGNCVLSNDAAMILSERGIHLIGVESQSIAPVSAPAEIHKIVLGQAVVALEGLFLTDVPDGEYFLSAAPINLGGSDGSPCRAVLIDFDDGDTEN